MSTPRRDWPGNVVPVGPCDWDQPADRPGWLQQLDRPVVLVTTSSEFQDDARLVQVALEGLADELVAVVATLPAGDPTGLPGAGQRAWSGSSPTGCCWTAPPAPSSTAA